MCLCVALKASTPLMPEMLEVGDAVVQEHTGESAAAGKWPPSPPAASLGPPCRVAVSWT